MGTRPQEHLTELHLFLLWLEPQYERKRFTARSCHDLAVALQHIHGGSLKVCYFNHRYDHTVFVDDKGETWDIGGTSAVQRWNETCYYWDQDSTVRWEHADEAAMNRITTLDWELIERIKVQWEAFRHKPPTGDVPTRRSDKHGY